jgi:hypothetical protein
MRIVNINMENEFYFIIECNLLINKVFKKYICIVFHLNDVHSGSYLGRFYQTET